MRIELITIGSELLLGFTIDTNAAYAARVLADLGIEIGRRTTVGDDPSVIAAAVGESLERTGAVITTGGLGPTADDLTKPAIASLFGRAMRLDHGILASLRERWRARGLPGELPRSNEQQALIPEGARVLVNRHGSAPGIWLEDDRGRWVAMLPGVPREMRGMLQDELLPVLRERVDARQVVRSRTLRTAGVAESALADMLGELAGGPPGLPLAYIPNPEGVDLRITIAGRSGDESDRLLADGAARLRELIGRYVYGEDEADLAAIVLERARSRGMRIAAAESCTGGLLAARLTAIPGASDVFLGGVVAYDDSVKREALGVSDALLREHGAVSEPVASAMAAGVCRLTGADIGVAITGIAGPSGGTPGKPVGTIYIGVQREGEGRAWHRHFLGDREEIRRRTAQVGLDFLRREVEQVGVREQGKH